MITPPLMLSCHASRRHFALISLSLRATISFAITLTPFHFDAAPLFSLTPRHYAVFRSAIFARHDARHDAAAFADA